MAAFAHQRLCMEYLALKHACPKGIYLVPANDPLCWEGVMFVRKGPYANAILRFTIDFGTTYPERPPVITFGSDVFHPLVTPLTTYTRSSRDAATDTVSAADGERLPPGGFALQHGFPEWCAGGEGGVPSSPQIIQVLQYLHLSFDTEAVIDSIPLSVAANSGAWHAWKSFRIKSNSGRSSPAISLASGGSVRGGDSPRQQPGGARRPGEWNWQGVWEDRVKRSIATSNSDQMLYGGEGEAIKFLNVDPKMLPMQM
ncbi:hypothetical protein K470DRAFT_1600 [Piedraia hortae CBS 480.64]|uniref:UBC core domain-containing protein n=1 Tax=Piedraia hortae CBS 480.64 TaxID=1314780 RepID=A0A6A7CB96_9PEZI|nr:hypothetical protein K470DRAFT_1600 [Piedraia hortae CBS 480.64]